MYITGQFQIVRTEIENLIETELGEYTWKNSNYFTKLENDKILAKLSKIVQKHNDTIKLSNDMVNAFVPVILVHFITAAITLGISCIGIMTVS